MSWYVHPSKQLRDDELPPELVVTNGNGSIEQVYVPEKTCHLEPWEVEQDTGFYDCMECACGYVADVADWNEWRFCPSCGRRVMEVDE